MISKEYYTQGFYDELFRSDNKPYEATLPLINQLESMPLKFLLQRQKAAESALLEQGITFSVNGNKKGIEKIFPFDIIPRVIKADEWDFLERGLKQRTQALNLFIHDVYHEQKILKDNILPRELILSSPSYKKQCLGLTPPLNVWAHISGTDLVRDDKGNFFVLEDNLRCPSGVSYVLENRAVLKQTFPFAFKSMNVRPVSDYPERLLVTLEELKPEVREPTIVLLTPGIYNSAYFEHAYLAKEMGVQLAESRDLIVEDDFVFLKTTKGFERVDVIYRRIDDDFLDPEAFRKDSLLGISGIMRCYKKGNVAIANAPGAGIADDKAVYAYIPDIIKYYLDEEICIPNVPTYLCSDKQQLDYTIEHMEELVVKPTNSSGGYGILIGPQSTSAQRDEMTAKIKQNPRDFIAQPTISLSRSPTIRDKEIVGRHVDFRPFILQGKKTYVLPGGLTRVALNKNSLIVNSSQGGGSKDTWVLSNKITN